LYTSPAGLVVVRENPLIEHIHHIKSKFILLNLICAIHLKYQKKSNGVRYLGKSGTNKYARFKKEFMMRVFEMI
jgi:hypothetical protein